MGTTPLLLFSPARSWTCDNVADMAVIMTTPFFRLLLAARSSRISCSINYITHRSKTKGKGRTKGPCKVTTTQLRPWSQYKRDPAGSLSFDRARRTATSGVHGFKGVLTRRKGSIRFQRSRNNGFPLIYLRLTSSCPRSKLDVGSHQRPCPITSAWQPWRNRERTSILLFAQPIYGYQVEPGTIRRRN